MADGSCTLGHQSFLDRRRSRLGLRVSSVGRLDGAPGEGEAGRVGPRPETARRPGRPGARATDDGPSAIRKAGSAPGFEGGQQLDFLVGRDQRAEPLDAPRELAGGAESQRGGLARVDQRRRPGRAGRSGRARRPGRPRPGGSWRGRSARTVSAGSIRRQVGLERAARAGGDPRPARPPPRGRNRPRSAAEAASAAGRRSRAARRGSSGRSA